MPVTSARPYDIAAIAGLLNDRAEALARQLLPRGHRAGPEWIEAASAQGGLGNSLRVNLGKAVWAHFAAPGHTRLGCAGGDMLDLIAYLLFNGDKKRALPWARAWLGLDGVDPDSIAVQRRVAAQQQRRAANQAADRARYAQGLFLQGKPIAGTLSEAYLEARGISFRRLGRMPGALRHHEGLVHPETGEIAPALIAAITAPEGQLCAVHRTFLERRADGSVGKLSGVEDAKLTLGAYPGGCIRLWRGAGGQAWKDAAPGEWLTSGEGIEDTATGVMAKPALRAAVAVSLANMGSMVLPAAIAGVYLLGQNDPALNKRGQEHPTRHLLQRAIENFQAQGKRVRLVKPRADRAHDVNELLMRGETAA